MMEGVLRDYAWFPLLLAEEFVFLFVTCFVCVVASLSSKNYVSIQLICNHKYFSVGNVTATGLRFLLT